MIEPVAPDWTAYTLRLAAQVQELQVSRKMFFGGARPNFIAGETREERHLRMLLKGGAQAERAKREVMGR